MKRAVIFRRSAQAEFDQASDWYEAKNPGQGPAFTAAIRLVLESIAARPGAHPVVRSDIREALVSRYPYAVYYRSDPNQITVLAIFHTARDPADWQGRS